MKKDINLLIDRFIQKVGISNQPIDYSDRRARKRHNDAVDAYR